MHDERIEDLMKMSPEAILLRWVNHHLERAGTPRRANNFTSDITDSEIYSHLMRQIAPADADVTMEALMVRGISQLNQCIESINILFSFQISFFSDDLFFLG